MEEKMKGLEKIIPDFVLNELQIVQTKFDINTILRTSHFLARLKVESANFTKAEENLNYSAIGLMNVFPKYFPDKLTADAYARQPERIANRVYANRMGNGDEASGDGWKHRGRGYIQLTGNNNQRQFINAIGEVISVEQISDPKYALLSAGWFWNFNGLNEIADKGPDEAIVKEVVVKINGGYNGLVDTIRNFNEIYSVLKP